MADKLTKADRAAQLPALLDAGWVHDIDSDALQKTFKFKDFVAAFAWMTDMADVAEELNHHPEWFNVYNRVEVKLVTHDADGLTALDVQMAKRMDGAA